jgi:hypothetical protein
MLLELIKSRLGVRRTVTSLCFVLACALVGASACSTVVTNPTAAPSPSASIRLSPTRTIVYATPTPLAGVGAPIVERVAIATEVNEDGSPVEETSAVSEQLDRIFLCVQVSELQAGTEFRAVWFEGGEIIGQSDVVAEDPGQVERWVSLSYRPVFPLKPNADHIVELFINKNLVERYAFRVGVGDARRVIAEATLALGTDANGIVGPGDRFQMDTEQIVLVARISNMVDPNGMTFDSFWYRGDTLVAKIGPDGGQPIVEPTPAPFARRMTFTFRPGMQFTPGDYRVDLLLNGVRTNSYRFSVTAEHPPTPTPTPTPAPTATPTEEPQPTATPTPGRGSPTPTGTTGEVDIDDVVITDEIDPGTNAPIGNTVFVWEAAPGSVVTLWVAIAVSDLTDKDVIAIEVTRNDDEYGVKTLPKADIDSGWLSTTVQLEVPTDGGDDYVYTVVVLVNGDEYLSTSMLMTAND